MHCFACDERIESGSGERVGFRDTCDRCGADLHVCNNCAFHDPSAYNECRESSSERVSDRERANRCDYFSPGGVFSPGSVLSPEGAPSSGSAPSPESAGGSPEAAALADLEALFKK